MARTICLDQFLKLSGLCDTGGQAKLLIQGGQVIVNDETESRRRRKLVIGDIVTIDGSDYSPNEYLEDQDTQLEKP